ncbi:unnamed protein product [Amoebophrya sp. A120]|nr:unnamed protein product [Amoebophrya sp. A120]|eukprot:GSA120T00008005001.1
MSEDNQQRKKRGRFEHWSSLSEGVDKPCLKAFQVAINLNGTNVQPAGKHSSFGVLQIQTRITIVYAKIRSTIVDHHHQIYIVISVRPHFESSSVQLDLRRDFNFALRNRVGCQDRFASCFLIMPTVCLLVKVCCLFVRRLSRHQRHLVPPTCTSSSTGGPRVLASALEK